MAARNWSSGDIIAEFGDLGSSVMSVDRTGDIVLLASKRALQFVRISRFETNPKDPKHYTHKTPRKNVKWEVTAAQWNPHPQQRSKFVITRNQLADIFDYGDGCVTLTDVLESHTRAITDLDWSPFDGNLLLTCSSDSNAFLWDTRECRSPAQIYDSLQSASQVKWNKVSSASNRMTLVGL